jgi:hypothetical protein
MDVLVLEDTYGVVEVAGPTAIAYRAIVGRGVVRAVQLSPSSEDAAAVPTVLETATKRPVLLHAIPDHKEFADIVLLVQLIPSVEDAATVPVCDTAAKRPDELHVTAPQAAAGITRAVQVRPSSEDAATVEFVLLTATKRPDTGLHATDIQFWAAMERKNQVIPSFE